MATDFEEIKKKVRFATLKTKLLDENVELDLVTVMVEGVSWELASRLGLIQGDAGATQHVAWLTQGAESISFVLPPALLELKGRRREGLERVFVTQCAVALTGYAALGGDVDSSLARSVLPLATAIKVRTVGTLEWWRHIIEVASSLAYGKEGERLAVHLRAAFDGAGSS